jgi:hypothetical protein
VPEPETPDVTVDSPVPAEAAATVAVDPNALATLELVAEDYASASRADSTLDTYVKHWNAFVAWCSAHRCMALPATAQTLVVYLAARAEQGTRPATLSVALSAIAYEHERAGHPSPTDHRDVKKTWRGIRRRLGTAPTKKDPLSAGDLQRMMEALAPGLIGVRDRALLLLRVPSENGKNRTPRGLYASGLGSRLPSWNESR